MMQSVNHSSEEMMDAYMDNREEARNRRRDRRANAAYRSLMNNGSAKRWHAVDSVIAKRARKEAKHD